MAVVLQRSKAGLVLIIIGLLTTPLFGIGVPIFVVGFICAGDSRERQNTNARAVTIELEGLPFVQL